MIRSISFAIVFAFTTSTFAADVIKFDQREDMATVIQQKCPWASAGHIVQRVELRGAQDIGIGGALGEKITDIFGGHKAISTATEIVADGIDPQARVVIFENAYYDSHDGQSYLEFKNLTLTNLDGTSIDKGVVTTEQAKFESIMICYSKDEQPFRVSATVTPLDAYGSRPTVGVSAYVQTPEIIPPQ